MAALRRASRARHSCAAADRRRAERFGIVRATGAALTRGARRASASTATAGAARAAAEVPIVLAALVVRRLLIDGDDHGGVAGTLRALEQLLAGAHVLPRIELPPQLSLRALRHLLDRLARVVAEAHRRVRRQRRRAIHAGFAVGMQRHLRRRRRDHDRIFQFQVEQLSTRDRQSTGSTALPGIRSTQSNA